MFPIVDRLSAAGVKVWIDREGISGGVNYAQAIAQAIKDAAALVLMSSAASLASRNVHQEIALAWKYERPYLPLLLEPVVVPSQIEYWLEGVQWIEVLDRRPEDWLPRVLAALGRLGFPLSPLGDETVVSPPRAHRVKLPFATSTLFGREDDLARAVALLRQPAVRLLTLTGPGGIGKTSLAIAVGHALSADFAQGVIFVDLAAVRDPTLVGPAIANALDLRVTQGQGLEEQLSAALAEQQLLLIVDNFEQVLEAAPLLARLLATSATLKLLVTSRAELHLRAEREFPIEPLLLPQSNGSISLEELARNPAVALFVERAQAVKPGFSLDEGNARAVVEICRRLDGLPLALELAAARLRVLSPSALLARLEHRLLLLTGGERDHPARHQTLRQTIAWSHDLLTPAEQRLFARLAVFAGGATLDAIEAVCGDPLAGLGGVLDGLDALARTSLVRRDEDGGAEPRFSMLETIREYATEQLATDADADTVRRAHASYYLALAVEAVRAGHGPEMGTWLDRLVQEHDNLGAALGWALAAGEAETALRLVAALREFWQARGYLSEGRRWADAALTAGADAPAALRAPALLTAGWLAAWQADWEAAEAAASESLGLFVASGDRRGEANAHYLHGFIARLQRDHAAVAHFEASLALWQALGDRRGVALAHREIGREALLEGDLATAQAHMAQALVLQRGLGWPPDVADTSHVAGLVAMMAGDYPTAIARLRESLALWRALGDQVWLSKALNNLGLIEAWAGDLNTARPMLEEALATNRALGDQLGTVITLGSLAFVLHEQGEDARAWGLLAEGLPLAVALGDREMLPHGAAQLAGLLAARGEGARAARLYGAVAAWRETTGIAPRYAGFEPAYQRDLALARSQLSAESWAAAWEAGRQMSVEAAIAEALAAGPLEAPQAQRR